MENRKEYQRFTLEAPFIALMAVTILCWIIYKEDMRAEAVVSGITTLLFWILLWAHPTIYGLERKRFHDFAIYWLTFGFITSTYVAIVAIGLLTNPNTLIALMDLSYIAKNTSYAVIGINLFIRYVYPYLQQKKHQYDEQSAIWTLNGRSLCFPQTITLSICPRRYWIRSYTTSIKITQLLQTINPGRFNFNLELNTEEELGGKRIRTIPCLFMWYELRHEPQMIEVAATNELTSRTYLGQLMERFKMHNRFHWPKFSKH